MVALSLSSLLALVAPGVAAPGPGADAAAPGQGWEGPSGYAMVAVPAGRATLGSPADEEGRERDEARVEVELTRGFWMGRTEVGQALWREVMRSSPSVAEYKGESLVGDDLPVQNVSWCDAVAFANALSVRDGLAPVYSGVEACTRTEGESVRWDRARDGYRLPTEAEWEHAARAGGAGRFAGAGASDSACAVGNVADRTATGRFAWKEGWGGDCTDGHAGPAPLASFPANAWGLHDMSGNVFEWCWDRYGVDRSPGTDPLGPETGHTRVFRGGSWHYHPREARLAARDHATPHGAAGASHGLRLVRTAR